MILGFGFDLLDTRRVEQELGRGAWQLADGVFTPREVQQCNADRHPARRFAACFAAKEAVLKALGRQPGSLASFREVEVQRGRDRGYRVVLHHRLRRDSEQLGVRRIWLSLAQPAAHTAAMVILEA